MKCRVIRGDMEVSPAYVAKYESVDGVIVWRDVMSNGAMVRTPFFAVGAVLDEPDAYRLVQHGCAESADEECFVRAARTPEQLERARYAYERQKHVPVQYYDHYDKGYILGVKYNDDGSEEFIPGPKWAEWQAILAAEDEDDDE